MRHQLIRLILGIPISIFSAFIFSKMWGWFIVTKFGIPTISIGEAMGILITLRWLTTPLDIELVKMSAVGRAEERALKEKQEFDENKFDVNWTLTKGLVFYPVAYTIHLLMQIHLVTP